MGFADKLRREAPSKAEILEKELLEKKQREEVMQVLFDEKYKQEFTSLLSCCEYANSKGEKYIEGHSSMFGTPRMPNRDYPRMPDGSIFEMNKKEEQDFYSRIERALKDALKAEGFKRRIAWDGYDLYYRISW